MVDARRLAVVVICHDVQVGVGVQGVVMVTTEIVVEVEAEAGVEAGKGR